jgi:hypothetical protein
MPPPRSKLPAADRISHGMPHRLLVLSNVHREDLIALQVMRALNDAAIMRLVGSQLQEQQEEWQLEHRRFFSEATMT